MTVQEISQKALEYLKGFYPDANKPQLEEVEITDDNQYWFITLSYESSDLPENPFVFTLGRTRKFKIFKIDAKTGEVKSMKIREFK